MKKMKTKKRAIETVMVIAISLVWSLTLARAVGHTERGARFDVRVPFEFIVGNHVMPAGRYRFEQILDSTSATDILLVRSMESRAVQAITTAVLRPPDMNSSRLVFQRYGDHTFLSAVWIRSKRVGLQLHESVLQSQVAREQPSGEEVSLPFTEEVNPAKTGSTN
jgi:hypothetical protein